MKKQFTLIELLVIVYINSKVLSRIKPDILPQKQLFFQIFSAA